MFRGSSSLPDATGAVERGGALAMAGRHITSRCPDRDLSLDGRILGRGQSGAVKSATRSGCGGAPCAVKGLKLRGLPRAAQACHRAEAELHLSLDHSHIVRLEQVYETEEGLFLVMEALEGGELYDRLLARGAFRDRDAASTLRQIISAASYLHGRGIVHRDLKLENFVYEQPDGDHLKLLDFGFAERWDGLTDMNYACGTLFYMAPELIARAYGDKVDMWSIGVVAYLLLCNCMPWAGTDAEVKAMIRAGTPLFSAPHFQQLSSVARDFVRGLLAADPDQRLSAAEALRHPWIASSNTSRHPADFALVRSLRGFADASPWMRACLSMIAWSAPQRSCAKLRAQFEDADVDGSGLLTLAAFRRALDASGLFLEVDAAALFGRLDLDGDGVISLSEFLAAGLHGRSFDNGTVQLAFNRFDADQDGRITACDLRAVLGPSFDALSWGICLGAATGDLSVEDFRASLVSVEDPRYGGAGQGATSIFSWLGMEQARCAASIGNLAGKKVALYQSLLEGRVCWSRKSKLTALLLLAVNVLCVALC